MDNPDMLPDDIAAAIDALEDAAQEHGWEAASGSAGDVVYARDTRHAARAALNAAILARLTTAAEDDAEATCRAIRAEAPTVTPAMLAAAWATWRSRYPERLGPGPAFREAIEAAFAAR